METKQKSEVDLQYRENDYFNDKDTFVFQKHDNAPFESMVHYEKGYWWTNEGLNYKCTSIKSYNKSRL